MGASWAWLIGAGALSVVGFEIHSLGLRGFNASNDKQFLIISFLFLEGLGFGF